MAVTRWTTLKIKIVTQLPRQAYMPDVVAILRRSDRTLTPDQVELLMVAFRSMYVGLRAREATPLAAIVRPLHLLHGRCFFTAAVCLGADCRSRLANRYTVEIVCTTSPSNDQKCALRLLIRHAPNSSYGVLITLAPSLCREIAA
jgi:hypothetical protein